MEYKKQTVKESGVRALMDMRADVSVTARGLDGGFAIYISNKDAERMLCTSKGDARLFASLNTTAAFLRRLGIARFDVDASQFKPGRLRKARPDRSIALRRTRTAMKQQSLI